MNKKPILLLANPASAIRPSLSPGFARIHLPGGPRQSERLGPQFALLQTIFDEGRASLRHSPGGAEPEHVLVLEIVGLVADFLVAVKNTKGMDWLGEWDIEDIPCDEDFFIEADEKRPNAKKKEVISGRLFLVVSNLKAINQVLSLWARYQKNSSAPFPQGKTKWRDVFNRLKTLRRWGVQDRLRESGLFELWLETLPLRTSPIRFEAELFYRIDIIKQNLAFRKFEALVKSEGGRCLRQSIHKETCYHGVLVEFPVESIRGILDRHALGEIEEVHLFTSEQVMFFRPVGQSSVRKHKSDELEEQNNLHLDMPLPTGSPLVAVFDGLPLENHPLLHGRLRINDPSEWADNYLASERRHGTGMVSLVALGELGTSSRALGRPVYVRPILKLDLSQPHYPIEQIPDDTFPADLTFCAMKEMFDGTDEIPPAAPDVRVVNMSVGDGARQYDGFMSPWARMLDWLAWKYKVLFLVSAGNHTTPIQLEMSLQAFTALDPLDAEATILKVLADNIRNRRILSPAESFNSITVGATHSDESNGAVLGYRKNPYIHALPATYSAIGFGHRNSLKPDIWLPGGRECYGVVSVNNNGCISLQSTGSSFKPGHCVAGPTSEAGEHSPVRFTRGTSNATALASHHAGIILEKLISLRSEPNGSILEDSYLALFTKALLAHGATWGEAYEILKTNLKGDKDETAFNRQIGRFLGFGTPDCERVLNSAFSRATMLGRGSLKDGKAELFAIPLPPSLSGKKVRQRITVTLAWFSPINPQHRNYRKASLWFTNPSGTLTLERKDVDWQAAKRGTLQHEVFETDKASAFDENEFMNIQINCRADAGLLNESIPYAVAITLEAADDSGIPVFDEVKNRLPVDIAVRQTV